MAMAGQGLTAGPPPRPAYHNSFGQNPGNQLYVGNVSIPRCFVVRLSFNFFFQLPYQAGWQDLKDLFRSAGNIIRADINIGADGRPKGSGTVIFETAKDAQQAIST
jgi:RNA recognition motif-containing protein